MEGIMAKNTSNRSWRGVVNLVAYVAIVCVGIALLIGKLGGGKLAAAFGTVAQILAYIVTAIAAAFFAWYKRHWAWWLVWVICVVLIVVLMIL